jgi:uncharacterized protein (TIGR02452 family)
MMGERKRMLAEVFQDTIDYCVSPSTPTQSIPGVISYNSGYLDNLNIELKPRFETTEVIVENEDTFRLTKRLIDEGKTTSKGVCALNNASAKNSGGGARNGASAQEECLFRCSNYFLHIPQALYPLQNSELLLSRDIWVFKDALDDYNRIQPFNVNCIACAARCGPKTAWNDTHNIEVYKYSKDRDIMRNKVEDIFKVAYLNNYDTLVLGALGCGAFGNPPHEVAKIFLDTIKKYNKCFKTISFAVLSFGKNQNYEIFKTHIEVASQSVL